MRLRIDRATTASALADYLRERDCIVTFVDPTTLEVSTPPRSLALEHEEKELDAYVRAWRAGRRETDVHFLSPRLETSASE
jgi:hypothetical protein